MTEKQTKSSRQVPPPSPLKPYRNIIERNPIEDHFTDKRLRKQMRHVGLVPKSLDKNNRDPTSLAREEHDIYNSGKEKYKRFQRKFITAIVDAVQEVDRARQAEFRDQLDLWDKMYSNRLQRIQAHDIQLERKYGLFVDREMKKELIREHLTQIPRVPSVSIPRLRLPFPPKRRLKKSPKRKRPPSAPLPHPSTVTNRPPLDDILTRLTKLENDFSTFENQDFDDCRTDVELIKTNIEMLINDKNLVRDEMNQFKHNIEELQIDLNEIAKVQDVLKIIQLEHENKIFELTKLENKPYPSSEPTINYEENLRNILYKQDEFDESLRTITDNMNEFQKITQTTDKKILEINENITKQQQQLEESLKANAQTLQQQIATLEKQLQSLIKEEINKVKEEIVELKDRITNLEETVNGNKLPEAKKKDPLPYVEKLDVVDLFDIDWKKYLTENQISNNH